MRCTPIVFVIAMLAGGCAGQPLTGPGPTPAPGCVDFPAQATSPYILPYETGSMYLVGRSAEHGDPQRYAIDWLMPIGTPVIASRAGTVIEVEARWPDTDHTFGHENHVFVRHVDGTVSRYHHLSDGGVIVASGASVQRGQRLALSGNSGNSAAPHLHFDVTEGACEEAWPAPFNQSCQRTIPVTFRNTSPNACGVVTGGTYRAERP